jgi:cell division control protein 6
MAEKERLDKIFDQFMTAPTIFKNQKVLQPSYVPGFLPHRTNQIERIGLKIASVLRGGTPSNIFCYGKTGTGKTAVSKSVLDGLVEKCKTSGIQPPLTTLINCRATKAEYSIFRELGMSVGVDVPHTGLSKEKVFNDFVEEVKKTPLMIIVLDEIDQLLKEDITRGNDILYKLTALKAEANLRVSLIGISNDLKFKEYLDPRVMSRLGEEEILFPPYTASELQDILEERAKEALLPGTIKPGVIQLCAALSAQEHGDARRAIDLLRVAAEVASRKQSPAIEEKFVREASREIVGNLIVDSIQQLTIQSKLVLCSVYLLEENKVKDAVTGDLYNVYSEISDIVGIEKLTQRRISDLISELDMLGLVNAQVISKGRYGRTKRIKLSVPRKIITDTLYEDPRIGQLSSYSSSILKSSVG